MSDRPHLRRNFHLDQHRHLLFYVAESEVLVSPPVIPRLVVPGRHMNTRMFYAVIALLTARRFRACTRGIATRLSTSLVDQCKVNSNMPNLTARCRDIIQLQLGRRARRDARYERSVPRHHMHPARS